MGKIIYEDLFVLSLFISSKIIPQKNLGMMSLAWLTYFGINCSFECSFKTRFDLTFSAKFSAFRKEIEMIKVECRGVTGFAVKPKMGKGMVKRLIEEVNKDKCEIAFVDVALSFHIHRLLSGAEQLLRMYIDHHLPYNPSIPFPYKKCISTILKSRDLAPSCCELVQPRLWLAKKVKKVFFHDDMDGFFSFLRGCGITYERMIPDIRRIDGRFGTEPISETGIMVANFLNFNYPSLNASQKVYSQERRDCYKKLIDWFSGEMSRQHFDRLVEFSAQLKSRASAKAAYIANEYANLVPGGRDVVQCDLRNQPTDGRNINFSVFWKEIEKKYPNVVVAGIIFRNDYSEKVLVMTSRNNNVDLRKVVPRGCHVSVAQRAFIHARMWPMFIANWRNYRK